MIFNNTLRHEEKALSESDSFHQSLPLKVLVRPVTSRRDYKTFIKLPRIVYAGQTGYTPAFDMEQNDLFHPNRNKIYQHADVCLFIAWSGEAAVGRISAVVDYEAIKTWNKKIGWFGALDAVSDRGVIEALLKAAEAWLCRKGMHRMRGPVTLGYHGESGLMVTGQQESAMVGTPWHPPEFAAIMDALGFEQAQNLLTYRLDLTREDLDERHAVPGALNPGEGKLGNISVSKLSKRQIAAQGEILRSLYNDGWADTYNFVPLQKYEMTTLIKQLKPILKPEHYVQIDRDGEPVAMALVVPNIYDIAGDLGGAPSPVGWLKLGARLLLHRFRSARVILLGVSKSVRGTVLGALLPSLAIAELIRRRSLLPYEFVELGWILESNLPMLNLVQRLVASPNKTHRLYEKDINILEV